LKECFGDPKWENLLKLEKECEECEDKRDCLDKYYEEMKHYKRW
jgi:hypothetical protein